MDNTAKHTPGPWKAVQHPREHKWAWTDYPLTSEEEAIVLEYAQQFYYEE